jgi:hypothetical protein
MQSGNLGFGIVGSAIDAPTNSVLKLPIIPDKMKKKSSNPNNIMKSKSPANSIPTTPDFPDRPSGPEEHESLNRLHVSSNSIKQHTHSNTHDEVEGDSVPIITQQQQQQQQLGDASTKPVGMQRAKIWSTFVENSYRFQLAGFRDLHEYLQHYPEPEFWEAGGFIKCLRARKTGYFMYFRKDRECADKHVNRIIMYQY